MSENAEEPQSGSAEPETGTAESASTVKTSPPPEPVSQTANSKTSPAEEPSDNDNVAKPEAEDTEDSANKAAVEDAKTEPKEDSSRQEESADVEKPNESPEESTPKESSGEKPEESPESKPEESSTLTVPEDSSAESASKEEGAPVVSNSKKSRPPFKYDPNKIVLRFLFANRDGLTVTVECKPGDTVGEVKGALLSVWPDDLPGCSGGDRLRLICMGKGILMPDTRTLKDCEVPVFKTHPTPVNVSVAPEMDPSDTNKHGGDNRRSQNSSSISAEASQGCGCTIL